MSSFTLGKRPSLDGLRGLAIVLVLLLHIVGALPFFEGWFEGGFIGVEMFFVLSGFLITSLLLGEAARTNTINLRAFYRRRSYRLLPAFVLMVGVCLTLGLLFYIPRFGPKPDQLIIAGAALLYVLNLGTWALPTPLPIWSRPLWSLCVEMHFYALWPPVVSLAKKRGWSIPRILVGIILGSLAFRVVAYFTLGSPYHTILTPARLDGLGLGGLIAYGLHAGWTPPARLRNVGLLGLVLIGVLTVVGRTTEGWMVIGGYTVVNLTTGAILLDALDVGSWTGRLLSFAPLRVLGLWSYSIYLWHLPMFNILSKVIHNGTALVAATLVGSVALAGASTTLLEIPLRRRAQARNLPANDAPAVLPAPGA